MRVASKYAALLVPLLLSAPAALHAQDGFFFGQPNGSLSLRMGLSRPAVGGELFESMRERLTMSGGDFATTLIGADLLLGVARHLDVGATFEWSESRVKSEFRHYTYQDDSPIEQMTQLRRIPLMLTARYYPLPRGRALSRHVWIPNRFSPFVGGGAGVLWYDLEQEGDFVDRSTLDIFEDSYDSGAMAFATHVLGGGEYWLTPRVGVTAEGRYTWASTRPGYPFEFDSVDLSGWQVTAGLTLRFLRF